MKSIELTIALDFLSKFTPTVAISRYSPTADNICEVCQLSYPAEFGGIYRISVGHIVDSAKSKGLVVARNKAGEYLIGISATEFNGQKVQAVFCDSLICKHGPVKYSFVADRMTHTPIMKPICPHCIDGFERPTEEEINSAKAWLIAPDQVDGAPSRGAIYVAARELGYATEKPNSHLLSLKRKKRAVL